MHSEKPVCKLVGTDGNVFHIINKVSDCLRKAGRKEQASEFIDKAFKAPSYDRVLQLCLEYVEVV